MRAHQRLLVICLCGIAFSNTTGLPPAVADDSARATPLPSDKNPAADSIGEVTILAGNVYAVNSAGVQRSLTLQSKIWMGDKIDTADKSSVTILFNDKTTLSQGENGTMIIDEYVFTPAKADDCSFGMRFIKGACRVVTGAITDSNPNRFKVKMRMATIGIRGCELAFKTGGTQDDAYILDLGTLKSVQVTTTTDGTDLTDMQKNKDMAVDREKTKVVTITESMQRVSVVQGKGSTQDTVTMEEVNSIVAASSQFAPATYNVEQTGDSAVFTLQPQIK